MDSVSILLDRLAGGLIVSCQARAGHPFHDPRVIAAMAKAAEAGGAAGVRINGETDISGVRQVVVIPIIGLRKVWMPESPVSSRRHSKTPRKSPTRGQTLSR